MARERSRLRKLQRKTQKRREQLRRISVNSALPPGAARDFDEAEDLISRGTFDEAIPMLEDLARRYPRRVEIRLCLADAHRRSGDLWSYQATCQKIVDLRPDEPELWLALASAAVTNMQFATAHRAFAHMATTWPDHPDADTARETMESMRELLAHECRRRGMGEATGFRVLQLHDAINLNLQCGNYEKVCDTATQLLTLCPTFAPALNNRSEAHFLSARNDEAIADSRRVLEFDASNYHALANLTRHLYLSGRFDEALESASELKRCNAKETEATLKKAQAFAIIGDWEAVRQVTSDSQYSSTTSSDTSAFVEHLAGVALANLGDQKGARRHWRRASDAFTWAKCNLDDLAQPPGKRHGPWAFPLDHWVPRGVFEKLLEAFAAVRKQSETTRVVQSHFERYPHLDLLAEVILERSDRNACEMLIRLAAISKRPAILAALKKFALGRRGCDELRMQALMTLSQAEYLEGQVEFWRDGKLNPVLLMAQEISCEPTSEVPPEINELMLSAHNALGEGRGVDAEQMLDEVLLQRPDDITAQYNRAVALGLQDRNDEALKIIRQIHRANPEYTFARIHLATESISNGDLEQAAALLAPIAQKKRLHKSEYTAWCSANIQMALARKDEKMARSLLNAWEQMDPDDHRIDIWKNRIDGDHKILNRLRRFIKRPSERETY